MAFRPTSDHSSPTHPGYKNDRESRSEILIGTEVECDDNYRVRPTLSPLALSDLFDEIGNGRTYCKHDGSLNDGVELISEPSTLAHHMYCIRWKALCKAATKHGYRSHDTNTCGQHVHVGREQLGNTDAERAEVIWKVQMFLGKFKSQVVRFSRRDLSDLNQWARLDNLAVRTAGFSGDQLRDYAVSHYETYHNDHGHHYDSARYVAVNVNNRNTVEIRIFKGTLKRDTPIANLQFVHNVFKWAMTHSWDDLATATFTDVALCYPYNEIVGYMAHRGLVPSDFTVNTLPSSGRAPEFTGRDGTTALRG